MLSGRHAAPRMRRFAPCERLGSSAIKRCVPTAWVTTLCAWLTLSGWLQEMNRLQHKQETEINSRMAGLQAQTENASKVLSPHAVQGWCRGVTTGFCFGVQKARQLELRIASVDSQLAANKELSQRLDSVSCVCVPPRNQGCVLTKCGVCYVSAGCPQNGGQNGRVSGMSLRPWLRLCNVLCMCLLLGLTRWLFVVPWLCRATCTGAGVRAACQRTSSLPS